MWQTWVQSRAQVISLQIITSLPFSLLWLCMKDQEAYEICDFFPFAILFMFENVKPETSSRTCGRIGRTKWRRKCTQSSTNFETSQRFPGFSYIPIATAKKKWQCGMSMISLETKLRSVTFSQRNARNFDTSDLLPWTSGKWSLYFCFLFLNFILEVVRRGVRRGSPWTGPQAVHGPGP